MKNLDMVKVRLVPDYKLHSTEVIDSPEKAIEILKRELSEYDREAVCILNINAKGNPINASIVSYGELNSTIIHPREVFKCAILSSAAGILLIHNHPSGSLVPSDEDIRLTARLIEGGRILGIGVIDHYIVAPGNEHSSMRDMGLMGAMEKLPFDELKVTLGPLIELPEGRQDEVTNLGINRLINGRACSIPLTKNEISRAYFEQKYEFDKDYIIGYLEEIDSEPKKAQIFKLKYDLSIKKVLSSEALLQSITSELGRQKNKQAPNDEALMDMVISKALEDVPRRKPRKAKETER